MSSDGIETSIYQTHLFRLRSDIMKAEGDYLFIENLTFPDGEDWKALNANKIQLIDAVVEVKPYYNFATMAANGKGQISGDFPVYMNFYTGNTVAEEIPMNFSKIILSGKYVRGSATTGVKATYGPEYFKTVLATAPQTESDLAKANIANKENASQTIDDYLMESDKIVLQKGRVVICIRQSDFHVPKENLLTAPNSVEGADSGTAGSILRHLKCKAGKPIEEEDLSKGKKGRKGGNPNTTNDYLYPEDPVVIGEGSSAEKSLILDYPFWVTTKYTFKYWRKD